MATTTTDLLSLTLAPVTIFLPSGAPRTDLCKLALLSALVVIFFLFTGNNWLPGGAAQFFRYTEAIVHGTTLPGVVAQRDAGYPLVIIASGYPWLGSLITIFLVQAMFAIASPLLVYAALRHLSTTIAFYTGLGTIVSLSPIFFMKMIHHDQTYIFFSILALSLLLIFVQTKQIRFLYLFTLAAIAVSIARPAGNALFPIFLILSYIAVRGKVQHYLACAAIFALFLGGYAWHRYVIFDAAQADASLFENFIEQRHAGCQVFYNPYLNTFDYGVHLSPAIGPNVAHAIDTLRKNLQPSPRESKFINWYAGLGEEEEIFVQENMFPFTAEQLSERVLVRANFDYYSLLCTANEDRVLLHAGLEIARANPSLVARYFVRNLFHFIFNPGYKHQAYNFNGFSPEELGFLASAGQRGARRGCDAAPKSGARAEFRFQCGSSR